MLGLRLPRSIPPMEVKSISALNRLANPALQDRVLSGIQVSRELPFLRLRRQCRESTRTSISGWQKIALVNALGKWVAIKNKLIDAMEGEKLDDFRTGLK